MRSCCYVGVDLTCRDGTSFGYEFEECLIRILISGRRGWRCDVRFSLMGFLISVSMVCLSDGAMQGQRETFYLGREVQQD